MKTTITVTEVMAQILMPTTPDIDIMYWWSILSPVAMRLGRKHANSFQLVKNRMIQVVQHPSPVLHAKLNRKTPKELSFVNLRIVKKKEQL